MILEEGHRVSRTFCSVFNVFYVVERRVLASDCITSACMVDGVVKHVPGGRDTMIVSRCVGKQTETALV